MTAAERHVLVGINAACTTAIAALATYEAGQLRLRTELTINGRHTTADIIETCEPSDMRQARKLGLRAAAILAGAELPVLLIRSEGNESDAESLEDLGVASISEPYVRITPLQGAVAGAGEDADQGDAVTLMELLHACARDSDLAHRTWLIVTSPMTVPSWLAAAGSAGLTDAVVAAAAAGVRAAATGERSATTLRELGFSEVLVPQEASARGLVSSLARMPAARALFPRGNLALRTLPDGLQELGWEVAEGVVYTTETVSERPASAEMIEDAQVRAIVVRSPSAVRALVTHARVPSSVPIVCAGRTTAEAATDAGLPIAAIAASPSSTDVARAVAELLAPLHES
jgi:uroporphyrinogen-III synthase